jgi:hypothetical protein
VDLTSPDEHQRADEQLDALRRKVDRAERLASEYRDYDQARRRPHPQ